MELNHDLVRFVLLSIESCNDITGPTEDNFLELVKKYGNFKRNNIEYTVDKLHEAGFITGKVVWGNNKPMWITPGNLTYEGHKFLDNVRDDSVWKETKRKAAVVGNASLSILSAVAANYISMKLGLK